MFVFDRAGAVIEERRTKPIWREENGLRVLADDELYAWMRGELANAVANYGVEGVMFSGHGCTFALASGDVLAHPILDYEQEPPANIASRIDALVPDFEETFSPHLPLGFNFGRHMLWLQELKPEAFAATDAILCYPQFWTWKFSGQAVSEVSYLGCHSHLWAPLKNDFSSLVDKQGWREKMPAFARAGAPVGTHTVTLDDGTSREITVHNGVHDSNASLHFYRSFGLDDFTLISTGTWVVIFNSACPLNALDRERDMLANVTVDGRPAPTIRFMGGREYDLASDGWTKPISRESIVAVIKKGIFALPSFAQGGPVPNVVGGFRGPQPTPEERAAAALLYVVLMTDLSLDLIRSENTVVIDGGLVKTGFYPELLAQLRPDQPFMTSATSEGSAFGAAALAFESKGRSPFENSCETVEPSAVSGLEAYRDRWRDQVEAARLGLIGENTLNWRAS
ncbi:carbohydrate kinase [Mesorhizobium sp. SB112]|uniref:FGGY-family carbohydrate kinase n=1 Tax=Mesorhizobium sp. SB112 TaxID=3151853 RepID=UPI003266DA17